MDTGRANAGSRGNDEDELKHPLENRIFVLSVILNVGLVVLAIYLATHASDWLDTHPILGKKLSRTRALTTGLALSPFALVFARNARRAYISGNGVVLSRNQFPDIYALLERQCAKIGLAEIPTLLLSDTGISSASTAFTARGKHFIVLGSKFVEPKFARVRELLDFTIARELGKIRFGHTKWFDEFLTAYVVRIPVIRDPLQKVRVLSLDRYAAALVPDGLPGLVALASGRLVMHNVNVPDYLAQVDKYAFVWGWVASVTKKDLPAMLRVRALYKAGFFVREKDVQRFALVPPENEWPADEPARRSVVAVPAGSTPRELAALSAADRSAKT